MLRSVGIFVPSSVIYILLNSYDSYRNEVHVICRIVNSRQLVSNTKAYT